MTADELRIILRDELAPIRAQLDGVPLLNRKLTVIEQQIRMLKSAFNDFARSNVTHGEIKALHEDVNRVQAENSDLSVRLATVERLIGEQSGGKR